MNTKMKPQAAQPRDPQEETIRGLYMESLHLVERLHRRLLDVIKDEFDREGRSDVNAVQALLLFNIGNSELTAGELRSRGYYLGSNVSYNVKKARRPWPDQPPALSRRPPLGSYQPDGRRPGNRRNRRQALRAPHRLDPEGRRYRFGRVHPDEQAPAAPRSLLERLDHVPPVIQALHNSLDRSDLRTKLCRNSMWYSDLCASE